MSDRYPYFLVGLPRDEGAGVLPIGVIVVVDQELLLQIDGHVQARLDARSRARLAADPEMLAAALRESITRALAINAPVDLPRVLRHALAEVNAALTLSRMAVLEDVRQGDQPSAAGVAELLMERFVRGQPALMSWSPADTDSGEAVPDRRHLH